MLPQKLKHRKELIVASVCVGLLVVGCLAPFAGKAFHIDDTLFLRMAEQIQKHPSKPYGFQMNWYGRPLPMVQHFDNPPLAAYYLALAAKLGGWSEFALHLFFLLPAIAAGVGIFFLARRYTSHSVLSAVIAVLTPVFVISGTSVMCDMLLLAFWTWAVVLFEKGLAREDKAAFWLSGLLAGMAVCTKYVGLAIVPLFAAYGICRSPRRGWWAPAVVLPLVCLFACEYWDRLAYGQSVLLGAIGVCSNSSRHLSILDRLSVGLSFLGGCFLPTLLFVPRLWSARDLAKGILLLSPVLLTYPYSGKFVMLWDLDQRPNWLLIAQSALFVISGVHILLLAFTELLQRRDAQSVLLSFWVLGIFVFASFLNWTINARILLPMLPAVGILVVRRIEWRASIPTNPETAQTDLEPAGVPGLKWTFCRSYWPAIPAALLCFWLATADYAEAGIERTAARQICADYGSLKHRLWFESHWGFQYYMEERGAQALEASFLWPQAGDVVVVPAEGVNEFDISVDLVHLIHTIEYPPTQEFSIMNGSAGAGFYAAYFGPFPFSLGAAEPQRFYIFKVTQSRASAVASGKPLSKIGAIGYQFRRERVARIKELQAARRTSRR